MDANDPVLDFQRDENPSPSLGELTQRTDKQGVRLVRIGMPERVVMADIARAITEHGLTLGELRAVLDDERTQSPSPDLTHG